MSTGIGLRIRNKRLELGISQEELASRMGLKSKSTICKIERGEDNLTAESVKNYSKALGVTVDYLYGNEDSNGNKTVKRILIEVQDEEEAKFREMYRLYAYASPDIQSAVDLLLKSSEQKK